MLQRHSRKIFKPIYWLTTSKATGIQVIFHILYKSTNLLNKRFYIGVHSTDDSAFGTPEYVDVYASSGNIILEALKRYGRENFDVEVIAYFDSVDNAYKAESDIVTEQFLKEHRNCYNLTVGGLGGDKISNHPNYDSIMQKKRFALKGKLIPHQKLLNSLNSTIEIRKFNSQRLKSNNNMTWLNKTTVTCHCGKIGTKPIMSRWHLQNCKRIQK